jgi:hypothetical protein
MSVLHYTNLLSVLISCTAEYRIIIADISKEVIRDGTIINININININIHQSYLIELFCSHAALLRVIYITIITPIMAFIDITITILIVLGNTVIIHSK